MHRFDGQRCCDNGYVAVVSGPEFLAHNEERTSVGLRVHEKKTGEIIADGRLASGSETEHEDEF